MPTMPSIRRWIGFAALACAAASVSAQPVTVVEYYHPALDHYFMTSLQVEIDALDSGLFFGWSRTGLTFQAFADSASGGPGVNPVCRFYIPPPSDSHFFSAAADECAAVLAKIPVDPNFRSFLYETPSAFYIALPDRATGACPAGMIPVYRLWNQRADSNHRYTTDPATKALMIGKGYVPEGYGPDAVVMCTPGAAKGDTTARVTGPSPFAPGCDGEVPSGVLYRGAEVEPMVAVDRRILSTSSASGSRIDGRTAARRVRSRACHSTAGARGRAPRRRCRAAPEATRPTAAITRA